MGLWAEQQHSCGAVSWTVLSLAWYRPTPEQLCLQGVHLNSSEGLDLGLLEPQPAAAGARWFSSAAFCTTALFSSFQRWRLERVWLIALPTSLCIRRCCTQSGRMSASWLMMPAAICQ